MKKIINKLSLIPDHLQVKTHCGDLESIQDAEADENQNLVDRFCDIQLSLKINESIKPVKTTKEPKLKRNIFQNKLSNQNNIINNTGNISQKMNNNYNKEESPKIGNEKDENKQDYESERESTIDKDNKFESDIHEWLDSQNIYITNPRQKEEDFYQSKKQEFFRNIDQTKSTVMNQSSMKRISLLSSPKFSQNQLFNARQQKINKEQQYQNQNQQQSQETQSVFSFLGSPKNNSKNNQFNCKQSQMSTKMSSLGMIHSQNTVGGGDLMQRRKIKLGLSNLSIGFSKIQ